MKLTNTLKVNDFSCWGCNTELDFSTYNGKWCGHKHKFCRDCCEKHKKDVNDSLFEGLKK